MGLSSRPYLREYRPMGGTPPGVRMLLIASVVVFCLQEFAGRTVVGEILKIFELYPVFVVKRFFVWEVVTYLFLHGGVSHILFNMLALWMFGKDLEFEWGTQRFLKFFFTCGVVAGVCVVVLNYAFSDPYIPTVGSSGAIYGILAASAVLWPDRVILYGFIFPIPMKYFVWIVGAISFFGSLNPNSGVSDIAHLGGLAVGFVLARQRGALRGVSIGSQLRQAYRDWKLERNKKKFQVYMSKHRSDRGNGPVQ